MKLFKSFYIQPRFFYSGLFIIALFVFSYFIPVLFAVAQLAILVLLVLFFIDCSILFFGKNKIQGHRLLPDKFSNGDDNQVKITIDNNFGFMVNLTIIDEVPVQFQMRNFNRKLSIKSKEKDN